ncbi:hypothetical protein A7A09_008190 [Paracoccus methylarcula]|uniref:Uncharacterized protein n=2 Tax=Paracoccus methylarcula TaxID=72022 RepID=A0A422QYK1_9RHOB|nr:hypothetical protein A7A09_008190 [Paracoccus methylarcula]
MLCLGLAACATNETERSAPPVLDPHDIQVIAAGKATCFKTTEDQNRIGARATNSVRDRIGFAPVEPNETLAKPPRAMPATWQIVAG